VVKLKLAECSGKLFHSYGVVCYCVLYVCSVMVERQVQSVGDFFQESVDTLIHQIHSCKLEESVKLVCVVCVV